MFHLFLSSIIFYQIALDYLFNFHMCSLYVYRYYLEKSFNDMYIYIYIYPGLFAAPCLFLIFCTVERFSPIFSSPRHSQKQILFLIDTDNSIVCPDSPADNEDKRRESGECFPVYSTVLPMPTAWLTLYSCLYPVESFICVFQALNDNFS